MTSYPRRAATSLNELLVAMSVASVIIGLTGTMIHRLLAAEHEGTRIARFSASVTRLSRTFRADVHAARDADLQAATDAQPAKLVLKPSDQAEVQYNLNEHLVTRSETEGGATIKREAFHFPPGSQLRFDRGPEGRLIRVELDLATGGREASIARGSRKLVIEAALARDHRFESTRSQEGQSP